MGQIDDRGPRAGAGDAQAAHRWRNGRQARGSGPRAGAGDAQAAHRWRDGQRARGSGPRAGAGDALARAFEMVATPALFGLAGWFVDGRAGTFPAVTLTAVLVVFSYQVWRFAREYSIQMDKALEQRRAGYSRIDADSPAAVADTGSAAVVDAGSGSDCSSSATALSALSIQQFQPRSLRPSEPSVVGSRPSVERFRP